MEDQTIRLFKANYKWFDFGLRQRKDYFYYL